MAESRRVLHPVLTSGEREELLRAGIELFNAGRFYDAHEAWEDIWRSTTPEPKSLFQGLIQVAAALHQFLDLKRDNASFRTLLKARERLTPYAPAALGLDLGTLLCQVEAWLAWLERPEGDPPPSPTLQEIKECRSAGASPTAPCG